MNSVVLSTSQEIKGGEKLKKLKNNKGFSLVELLIVIAIMGVLAVIAFNMFGGVLTSSKKKADDQMAQNIAKGILTYCIDSNDWKLTATDGASTSGVETVLKLTQKVEFNSKEYGPYFTLKDPDAGVDDAGNKAALSPQWNTTAGGDYSGWLIKVYPKSQNVTCVPATGESDPAVVIDETTGGADDGAGE